MHPSAVPSLSEFLQTAVAACVEQCGFVPPLILTGVAVNGSVCAVRLDGETAEQLASHTEGDCFVLPINIMLTDSQGEAARLIISHDGCLQQVN